jgi:hypothetical protein
VIDARPGKEKVVEEVKKVTGGQGADATLNVSDHESAAATGAAVTKMYCRVLYLLKIAHSDGIDIRHGFLSKSLN